MIMKHLTQFSGRLAAIFVFATVATASAGASPTNAPAERIGTYDSRAVAYAHFSSEAHQRKINDLVTAAKAARAAGETNRLQEIEAALKQEQETIHLQSFSTAPVDEVLAEMNERVAQIRKETGVTVLVSMWDEKNLKEHPGAERIDVTELLLRDFKLTEKQKKVIDDLRKQRPLPLEQAKEMMRKGEL
jgi:polyhydroxyalkanoate synthesis regulator phasin